MSEETPTTGDTAPQHQPAIRVLGQYIKDLSFEVPSAPEIFNTLGQTQLNLGVGVIVRTEHAGESTYEVVLEMEVRAGAGEQTAFLVELAYGAVIVLNEQIIPEEQIHPLLHIEVPRLLFPFARQIISDMCSHGGFPQLMLQIVDFGELYAKRYGMGGGAGPSQDAEPARTIN